MRTAWTRSTRNTCTVCATRWRTRYLIRWNRPKNESKNYPILFPSTYRDLLMLCPGNELIYRFFGRFIVYVPAVNARRPSMRVSRPSTSKSWSLEYMQCALQKELAPRSDYLSRIVSRMSTTFPDNRLVEHDCGKLRTLDALLKRLKVEQHRVLIFTQMARMLDVLEAFLTFRGHIYLRLDGGTKIDQRQVSNTFVFRLNLRISSVDFFNLCDLVRRFLLNDSTRTKGIFVSFFRPVRAAWALIWPEPIRLFFTITIGIQRWKRWRNTDVIVSVWPETWMFLGTFVSICVDTFSRWNTQKSEIVIIFDFLEFSFKLLAKKKIDKFHKRSLPFCYILLKFYSKWNFSKVGFDNFSQFNSNDLVDFSQNSVHI